MQNKTLIFTILIAMTLVIPNVMATTTLNVPVTETNYTTVEFNITTDIANALSCSVYYNASGGAATTLLGSIVNDTDGDVDFTETISIESLADALTYNFTANCTGDTDEEAVSVGSVGIDNTDATYTFELLKPENADLKGSQSLTWTTADATSGVETVAVTVTSSNEDTCPVQSWSTTSGTDEEVRLDCTGDYTAAMTITDNAGNSVTVEDPFKSRAPGYKTVSDDGTSMFGDFSIGGEGSEAQGNLKVIAIIAIIILVIWGASKK